jgi:hypothetical protein
MPLDPEGFARAMIGNVPNDFVGVQGMNDIGPDPSNMADQIVSRVTAQLGPTTVPYSRDIRDKFPGDVAAAMAEIDTGWSTADSNWQEAPVDVPIMVRPWPHDSWERTFVRGQTAFASRVRGVGNNGFQTIATPPVLNSLQERRARLDLVNAPIGTRQPIAPSVSIRLASSTSASMLRMHARTDDASLRALTAVDANEFKQKWDLLGTFTKGITGAEMAAEPMYNVAAMGLGESDVTNIFADDLLAAEKLYYIVGEFDAVTHGGGRSGGVGSRLGTTLQIRGFSSHTFPQHLTAEDGRPKFGDIDYIKAEHRMACTWQDFEWDADMKAPRPIKTLAQEGIQAVLEEIPTIVYDAYMLGDVNPLGIDKTRISQRETAERRLAAHFDPMIYMTMKTVNVFNFIWGEQ